MSKRTFVFEICNPSDPYTMEGEFEAACMAVIVLGNGRYGLKDKDGDSVGPPFILFGDSLKQINAYWEKEFSRSFEAAIEDVELKKRTIDALNSVLIGSFRDRDLFFSAVSKMSDKARDKFTAEWHDKKRSSMNDIGGYAKKAAAAMAETLAEGKA